MREKFVLEWQEKMEKWSENVQKKVTSVQRSDVKPVNPPKIPMANKITNLDGAMIPLDQVWDLIDKKSMVFL